LSNQAIDDESRRKLGDAHMNLSITLNRQGHGAESAEHQALVCHFYQKQRSLGFAKSTKQKKGRRSIETMGGGGASVYYCLDLASFADLSRLCD
jgi:hypothetical protein